MGLNRCASCAFAMGDNIQCEALHPEEHESGKTEYKTSHTVYFNCVHKSGVIQRHIRKTTPGKNRLDEFIRIICLYTDEIVCTVSGVSDDIHMINK